MKYKGTTPSSKDKDIPVYNFAVGGDELEILAKLTQQAYDSTPKVFEIMPYRGRLRNISLELAKVYASIKGKTLPTKRTAGTHKAIRRL